MHTYECETPDLHCGHCGERIPIGDQFCVITTPSVIGQNNCLRCANARMDKAIVNRKQNDRITPPVVEETWNRKQAWSWFRGE